MSRRSTKAPIRRGSARLNARQLDAQLAEIERLIERQPTEAARQLDDLALSHPRHPDVLLAQLQAAAALNDAPRYLAAAEKLLAIEPNEEIRRGLISAYILAGYFAMARQQALLFLKRAPSDPEAPAVRSQLEMLEAIITEEAERLGVPAELKYNVFLLHDQINRRLSEEAYKETIALARRLLKLHPTFPPALNNAAMAQFYLGRLDEAVALTDQLLDHEPTNLHALSNQLRYSILLGQRERAEALAERLRAVTFGSAGLLKKAEGLAVLPDHAGIVALYKEGSEEIEHLSPAHRAHFLHLAAVAHHGLGRVTDARRLWSEALALSPGYPLAQENLDDLARPIGQRNGPWFHTIDYWIPRELIVQLSRASASDDRAMKRQLQRHVGRYPWLRNVIPVLLEQGDGPAREYAFMLGRALDDPEIIEHLKRFAFGDRGTDKQRMSVALWLYENELLPSKIVTMWQGGERQEVRLLTQTITTETDPPPYSEQNLRRIEGAYDALGRGEFARAAHLYEEVIADEAEIDPSTLNNLAMAYFQSGRSDEANQLVDRILSDFPDYFFGKIARGGRLIVAGKLDEAEAILQPLALQEEYHISEYSALCRLQMDLALARKSYDQAQATLERWENIYPDDPLLIRYRARLEVLRRKPRWPWERP